MDYRMTDPEFMERFELFRRLLHENRSGAGAARDDHVLFSDGAGGCEPQLTGHARGNINLGNDKAFLIKVISQCLPYIGYPRSLNAIACVNKAAD